MKKMLCAAATAVILAGCAGGPQMSVASAPSTTAASTGTLYCAKERLLDAGGRLECNWEPSFEEACRFAKVSTLQRSEVAGDPQPAGRCETGQWLVKVARR